MKVTLLAAIAATLLIPSFSQAGRIVWPSTSSGSGFYGAGLWHDYFCVDGEIPGAGDFNGDGMDDIACFTRGSDANVWVSTSSRGHFWGAGLWHDFFCVWGEICLPGAHIWR